MGKSYFLGIDLGTTVLKACVFNAGNRNLVAQSSRVLSGQQSQDGRREQQIKPLLKAFNEVLSELQIHLGIDWKRIEGIGLAAQGGSSIIADRVSGKARTPMILWNDGRIHRKADPIHELIPEKNLLDTILTIVPPAGLSRLQWLQIEQPELFTEENIHVGAGEFLFFHLTGVWRQDAGNAIQIGSYNAVTQQLDDILFRYLNLPLSFVAPLRNKHETASLSKEGAKRLKLPADVPVAGPYIDQEAAYLSAASISDRPLQCSLGTAWVGNFVLPEWLNGGSNTHIVIPSPTTHKYMVIQPLITGNPVWEWALRLLDSRREQALAKAGSILKLVKCNQHTPIVCPWFAEKNPLECISKGGGAIVGIDTYTTIDDIVLGVAISLALDLERMFAGLKETDAIDSAVIGGGAGNSSFLREAIATLFAPLPVYWQKNADLTAACGCLYAFDPSLSAKQPHKRIKPTTSMEYPLSILQDRYRIACDRIHSENPRTQPYAVEGEDA